MFCYDWHWCIVMLGIVMLCMYFYVMYCYVMYCYIPVVRNSQDCFPISFDSLTYVHQKNDVGFSRCSSFIIFPCLRSHPCDKKPRCFHRRWCRARWLLARERVARWFPGGTDVCQKRSRTSVEYRYGSDSWWLWEAKDVESYGRSFGIIIFPLDLEGSLCFVPKMQWQCHWCSNLPWRLDP